MFGRRKEERNGRRREERRKHAGSEKDATGQEVPPDERRGDEAGNTYLPLDTVPRIDRNPNTPTVPESTHARTR